MKAPTQMSTKPASHTPEPWLSGRPEIGYSHEIEDRPNRDEMALLPLVDYNRAIACVNALRGIAEPEAALRQVRNILKQIDEGGDHYADSYTEIDSLKIELRGFSEQARAALALLPDETKGEG